MSPLLLLDLARTIDSERRREARRQAQAATATAQRSGR
jgi:hypothetical protein